jgi:hypothetical protein
MLTLGPAGGLNFYFRGGGLQIPLAANNRNRNGNVTK